MSGSIHKEALADAKKLREVAEANAKNAIMEQITPTIKDMIEKELLGESAHGMEEDVLISPEEREEEKKEKGEKEGEYYYEGADKGSEDNVQLTAESVQALAQMASARSEHYGVRSLRIANKLDALHEAKVNEVTYGEKLRQLKNEIEKTFVDLQEDKKKNIVPEDSGKLIETKLEELWEITNKLMIPVKVRLINESNKRIVKKYNQFKMIAEEYDLTKEAKSRFGKECIKLTKEVKALLDSMAELNEVVEDGTVNKVQKKVSKLFKEIYKMSRKFGSLNEEELRIVISGLDMDDPEGSALTAMVEPAEEEELGGEELGAEEDLGAEELGAEELDMDEGLFEAELDELAGGLAGIGDVRPRGKAAAAGALQRGGAGRGGMSPKGMELARQEKEKEGLEYLPGIEDPVDEYVLPSVGEPEARPGARRRAAAGGRMAPGKSKALGGAPWEEREEEEARKRPMDEDEMLEISEAMLKQELLRLKQRRAAMNEAMKAMQHSPGGGPGALDNYGGAGRQLGGGVEGELFYDYDSDDLNDLDPVGTGFPVNENELAEGDALDELKKEPRPRGKGAAAGALQRGAKGRGEKGKALGGSPWEEREEEEAKKKNEGLDINQELVENIKAYKGVVGKLRSDNQKMAEELRKSNLSNAKLVYATKLMQNENLSEKQRRTVLEQLDKTKTVREVKKLFTALKEALEGKSEEGKLTESVEDRKILGGSSKATKPGASTLTESEQKEFTRWGELAGFLNE